MPQEIEPRLPKNIKGTLLITAQTSKSHFQRDRCGFRKSTCRSNGKLISRSRPTTWVPKPLLEQSLHRCYLFPMEKNQHRPGDSSGRGLATQIEAPGLENELPVYTARRFPKNTQVGLCTEKGCPTAPRKRPRVRQRISKETPNQPKVPPGIPREARWTPSFPQTPQRPSQETILPPKDLLGYHFASHLEHVLTRENQ